MPIYEYQCSQCGRTFELLQNVHSEALTRCIYCEGKADKLISAPSFQFKGAGWYITDYKKNTQPEPKKETAATTKGNSNASV